MTSSLPQGEVCETANRSGHNMAGADRPKDWAGFPNKPLMRMDKANESRPLQGMAATNFQPPTFDWSKVASNVRSEIARADWTERQSRVAEFMVAATLDRGRQEVKGINLEELGALLGVSKGNLSDVFYELQLCGFLQVIESPLAGKVYRVLPASEHWSVRWRYDRAAFDGYMAALDVASGHAQNELFEPEPDLKAAVAETQLEKALACQPPLNRKDPARLSVKVSSAPSSTSNRIIRDKDLEISNKSNFEGISTDFTDGEKPVNNFPVPESGTTRALPPVKDSERAWYEVYNEAMKRNWADDGYLYQKLRTKTALFEELWDGKTRMAREFCLLFKRNQDRTRELAAIAVQKDSPAKWLNHAVSNELLGKDWRA